MHIEAPKCIQIQNLFVGEKEGLNGSTTKGSKTPCENFEGQNLIGLGKSHCAYLYLPSKERR
jgi:hypothetical protein